MVQTWRRPFRLSVVLLAVLLAQPLVPSGATADDPERAPDPEPAQARLLEPNLVVLKAADLSIQRAGSGRYLRFESALGNVGRGPVEIRPNTNRPCPSGKHHSTQVIYRDLDDSGFYKRDVDTRVARRSAGCMIFHPAHDHWHFQAAARYTVFDPRPRGDVAVTARRKMSFCLRDTDRVPAQYGTFRQPERYGACSRYSAQGISVGWADVYQSFLAGQSVRLPSRVRDGLYCLQIEVDPRDQLVESDDTDNTSLRAFALAGDTVRYRRTRHCRR